MYTTRYAFFKIIISYILVVCSGHVLVYVHLCIKRWTFVSSLGTPAFPIDAAVRNTQQNDPCWLSYVCHVHEMPECMYDMCEIIQQPWLFNGNVLIINGIILTVTWWNRNTVSSEGGPVFRKTIWSQTKTRHWLASNVHRVAKSIEWLLPCTQVNSYLA